MKLAVDVGYGYTKALAETGRRACFPSACAPAPPDVAPGVFAAMPHRVEVFRGGKAERYLVGEAALRSRTAAVTLAREKPPEVHDTLLLTAAYLAGAGRGTALAVGLPLAYYRTQRQTLAARLAGLAATVSVDGQMPRELDFTGGVRVIPQGAGVVLAEPRLLDGLIGVIDAGHHTTDYLLIEVRDGQPLPLLDYCGSVEAGAHLVAAAVTREFSAQTGAPLDIAEAAQVAEWIRRGQPVTYDGRPLNLNPAYQHACQEVGRLIAQRVLAAWGGRARLAREVLLAGGGALLLGDALRAELPAARLVADPVYANCRGYLAAL
jgi:plasmid segregation protein ParM